MMRTRGWVAVWVLQVQQGSAGEHRDVGHRFCQIQMFLASRASFSSRAKVPKNSTAAGASSSSSAHSLAILRCLCRSIYMRVQWPPGRSSSMAALHSATCLMAAPDGLRRMTRDDFVVSLLLLL